MPAPTTFPVADRAVDWLLSQSAAPAATSANLPGSASPAAPSTDPASPLTDAGAASQPSMPLQSRSADHEDARTGTLTLSDGAKITGAMTTTPDQPVRIFDPAKGIYRDIPFDLIKSMEAQVDWERDEKVWDFAENGSDIKVYSGKTYPARETSYLVTLINGQTITGAVACPLYVQLPAGQRLFVLHKRDKGDVGQTLTDLVYVKSVELN
jgi:hypothetical protein